MCGSGTIGIEAALLRSNTAPGLIRVERNNIPKSASWIDIPPKVFDNLIIEARNLDNRHSSDSSHFAPIYINDKHPGAIQLATAAAEAAGVPNQLVVSCSDVIDYASHLRLSRRTQPIILDTIITNPPWDRRLAVGADQSWMDLNDFIAEQQLHQPPNSIKGLWTLTGEASLSKHLGISRISKEIRFNAAAIDLSFLNFAAN
jgi:23S rRNA G2445 N2-methylase RlmL